MHINEVYFNTQFILSSVSCQYCDLQCIKEEEIVSVDFFLGTHSSYCMGKDKKFTVQESSSVKHFILLSSKNKGHEKIVLCWSNIILSYTILQDDQTL